MSGMDIFEFNHYIEFLNAAFPVTGGERGQRARLAEHLGCQSAFISSVTKGKVHLNVEHAVLTAEFLKLTPDETAYLTFLVQEARASSEKVKAFFQKQRERILQKRNKIKNRIAGKMVLKDADRSLYYKSWIPSAVHIALSIPGLNTPETLANHLDLPVVLIKQTLQFLIEADLAKASNGKYSIGNRRMHLADDDPLIAQHHTHWRLKAVQSFPLGKSKNLHYTCVMSLSESDRNEIRKILLKAIEQNEKIMLPSKEERLMLMSMDFFEVGG